MPRFIDSQVKMALPVLTSFPLFFLLSFILHNEFSSSLLTNAVNVMNQGSSLYVENAEKDVLVSSNGIFSAGFYSVGNNAYSFAIWFTQNPTVVWMANRDNPVNGKHSTLSLLKTANLVLTDAGKYNIWSTDTASTSSVHLKLLNSGNLILQQLLEPSLVLWQSFDFPTDTLLPQQQLTRHSTLVSPRSNTNYSSGYYHLFFDNDNILRLLYNGPEISSIYWPDPWLVSWNAGRSTYNTSRIAVLDSLGQFVSSDNFTVMTTDYGTVLQRRLKVDCDGNIRVFGRRNGEEEWYVSWQSNLTPCRIHGICGANSMCTYDPNSGRSCSCLSGYEMKDDTDWSLGCVPKFDIPYDNVSDFLSQDHLEFFGYDFGYYPNYTFDQCKALCMHLSDCKGFQHFFSDGVFNCFPKFQLLNGYRSPSFVGTTYLRVPERSFLSIPTTSNDSIGEYACPANNETVQLIRTYVKEQENGSVKFMVWFATGLGGLEVLCIFLVWFLWFRNTQDPGADVHSYALATNGFRRFTYSELKLATKEFSEEIGKGAAGVVYKGILLDSRVAAIKRLKETNQYGEREFLSEVRSIERLNHMNLIGMWGYCAEGKHRLLVFEYAEHGSLAQNIQSNQLDWTKIYKIAFGTARGLAYLHEECLEWILHCDIKPQNILLDSNFEPKVADFGLSKLLNRSDVKHSNFSMIRGTRGYMAPEWVFNLPITAKVDVYSYGIVVLEMLTGKSATIDVMNDDNGFEMQHRRLVTWVRDKFNKGYSSSLSISFVQEIMDPAIEGDYDIDKMNVLARVALQCVEEERNKRPTMNQVVQMLSE
ncbi:hypothetical protein Lal_00028661 [Lupinus albus]|uniref:Receptor-like serine/threonine-protein kinase n=1 Tax=Lupinus albus TaxID=3870 RepID=A0A6A4P0M2_LUPAL|nr:putative protein kinase RLK-Pelle-SD-2b family [Lupinus albus]KAF1884774.1 hypothetical protein Lal_00028661 [Lupinus albus]